MEQKLEAILFYKNEPTQIKKLASMLNVREGEVREGLGMLQKTLEGRGICLILTESEASLATARDMGSLIEQIARDELSKDIGKAGLETLAIILYNGEGVSRRKIDYIRGVNSTFILRNLMSRGLVEREASEADQRSFVYKPTIALLTHIGIRGMSELPDLDKFRHEMKEPEATPE